MSNSRSHIQNHVDEISFRIQLESNTVVHDIVELADWNIDRRSFLVLEMCRQILVIREYAQILTPLKGISQLLKPGSGIYLGHSHLQSGKNRFGLELTKEKVL